MRDQALESGRWHRRRGAAPLRSGVAEGSDRVAPGYWIGDGLPDVGLPGTSRRLLGPEIGPDGGRRWPMVVPLGERVLFDSSGEPVKFLGRQGPAFPEDLAERT